VLATDGVLAAGSLSKQDQESIRLAVSTVTGCDYCVAAHSLTGKMTGLSPDTLRQIPPDTRPATPVATRSSTLPAC
jgi:AhpD family alkylhydroperoxidase